MSTWTSTSASPAQHVLRFTILEDNAAISYRRIITLWMESREFRLFYSALLKSIEYKAFFWEVKPVTVNSLDSTFEFVVVNSSILPDIVVDADTFSQHFKAGAMVVSFKNLGGDAALIVPTPLSEKANYAHIAIFTRNAPADQLDAFWREVGSQYKNNISERPLWLSTAGLGVYWLHIRLDTRPKYYRYDPYKIL